MLHILVMYTPTRLADLRQVVTGVFSLRADCALLVQELLVPCLRERLQAMGRHSCIAILVKLVMVCSDARDLFLFLFLNQLLESQHNGVKLIGQKGLWFNYV